MNGEFAALRAIVTADTSQYERAMARAATTGRTTASVVARSGNQMDAPLQRAASSWSRIGMSAQRAGAQGYAAGARLRQGMLLVTKIAAVTAVGLSAVGVGALAVGVKFDVLKQRAQVAFRTMLGSTTAANKFLAALQKFAAQTPFQFADLIPLSQQMMAMGIAAKNVLPDLRAIGDAEALLGGGKLGLERVVLAIGQMGAKGKVSAEEMRQLTEAGINAWKYLAQAIYHTTKPTDAMIAKVQKLSSLGKIRGDKGVAAIIAGMERDFGGGMDKLNKTLEGQWSNLKDNLTAMMGTLAEPLMPVLLSSVKKINDVLGKLKLAPTLHAKVTIVWEGVERNVSSLVSKIRRAFYGVHPSGGSTGSFGGGMPASIATIAGGLGGGLGPVGQPNTSGMGVGSLGVFNGSKTASIASISGGLAPKGRGGVVQGWIDQLKNADWASIGQQIVNGMKTAVGGVEGVVKSIIDAVSAHSADFGKVGLLIALQMANAMTDPGFWAAHWQLILAVMIAFFPVGRLGVLGEKLSIAFRGVFGRLGGVVASAMESLLLKMLEPVERFAPRLASALLAVILAGLRIGGAVIGEAARIGTGIVQNIGRFILGAGKGIIGGAIRVVVVLGIASAIAAVVSAAAHLASSVVHAIAGFFSSNGGMIARGIIGMMIGAIAGVPGAVAGAAFAAGSRIGQAIADGVMSALAGMPGRIAGAIGLGGGGGSGNNPKYGGPPRKAQGGVVNRATLAVVGEGQGREFIIPDDPKYRNRAMGLFAQAGRALGIPGYAAGGVAGRPGASAYSPRYNWKRFRRSSLTSEEQTAADYDAATQRWDRYFGRDGNYTAAEQSTMIKRMTRYRSMLDRIAARAGIMAARDRRAAKRQKDPQKKSDLLTAAADLFAKQHDTHQASLDLGQDIADRVATRDSLLHPTPDLAAKLARYDDLDALIQAGMGPKGLSQKQNLLNELHYLKTVKGFPAADIARAINDVTGRISGLTTSGTSAAAEQPIQSQLDAATQAGFASGFGRLWSSLTGNLSDIGAGQGLTLSVNRLLIAPTMGNYATMANGANAGNDSQSFRIYSPVSNVGAP